MAGARQDTDGIIPIEQLGQGMVSTIGWIGTLLRRLYEAFPRTARSQRKSTRWCSSTRSTRTSTPRGSGASCRSFAKHFPHVQVIATSHSPLIVSNLEADEVLVFVRDVDGSITCKRIAESLRGYRADQVLTSPAFGLENPLAQRVRDRSAA